MAVAKKIPSATIPTNMLETLSSLNTAATTSIVTQVPREEPSSAVSVMDEEKNAAVPVRVRTAENGSTFHAAEPLQETECRREMTYSEEKTERALKGRELKVNETIKTMISLRLLKSDKEKFQEFFRAHGLSFTDGLYMAADFIVKEVDNGRLTMSKSGIQYRS